MTLPKGQYDLGTMPRFGLPEFTDRFPHQTEMPTLGVGGAVSNPLSLTEYLQRVPQVEQVSDFHCVTTWSCRDLHWEGIQFRDLYEQFLVPLAKPSPEASTIVFKCQDGYHARMRIEDLLADDVMLADTLNGEPLSIENGAPHRLVAPTHYGYKNAKHIEAIRFHLPGRGYKPPRLRFLEHERARVALEERGSGAPGWFLRYLYRPLVRPTIRSFEKAMREHQKSQTGSQPDAVR